MMSHDLVVKMAYLNLFLNVMRKRKMEKELEFRFPMLSENGWFLACVVGGFFLVFFLLWLVK